MTPRAPRPHTIGVLMLETQFPRPVGDVGHPMTFSNLGLNAIYQVLPGASPERIVNPNDPGLLQAFIAAAHGLAAQGATLITTSCGFLARYQTAMSEALPVPVITSSLLLCATLEKPIVLTIKASALSPELLQAAGVPEGTPIIGVPAGSHFRQQILGNQATLNPVQAQAELVALVKNLKIRYPEAHNLVLECTNMPPYAEALARASALPVHHLMTAIAAHVESVIKGHSA